MYSGKRSRHKRGRSESKRSGVGHSVVERQSAHVQRRDRIRVASLLRLADSRAERAGVFRKRHKHNEPSDQNETTTGRERGARSDVPQREHLVQGLLRRDQAHVEHNLRDSHARQKRKQRVERMVGAKSHRTNDRRRERENHQTPFVLVAHASPLQATSRQKTQDLSIGRFARPQRQT